MTGLDALFIMALITAVLVGAAFVMLAQLIAAVIAKDAPMAKDNDKGESE